MGGAVTAHAVPEGWRRRSVRGVARSAIFATRAAADLDAKPLLWRRLNGAEALQKKKKKIFKSSINFAVVGVAPRSRFAAHS
jgi:hypothetical protein